MSTSGYDMNINHLAQRRFCFLPAEMVEANVLAAVPAVKTATHNLSYQPLRRATTTLNMHPLILGWGERRGATGGASEVWSIAE